MRCSEVEGLGSKEEVCGSSADSGSAGAGSTWWGGSGSASAPGFVQLEIEGIDVEGSAVVLDLRFDLLLRRSGGGGRLLDGVLDQRIF